MMRDFVCRIGRNLSHPTVSEHSLPHVSPERTEVLRRDSRGVNEVREGITVRYDIWRTVEETTAVKDKEALDADKEL
jgi:hypothetical protein